MCWSGEASTVLAAVGIAGTAYAAYKKEPTVLWVSLGYFSLMEALQAFTYAYIDECSTAPNQIATLLGYIHIMFQPFFITAVSLHFLKDPRKNLLTVPLYFACFVSVVVMTIQLYPFEWAGPCAIGRPLCGPQLCSVSGEWHIAWDVPTNGIGNYFYELGIPVIKSGFITYPIVGFLLPLLYGAWRITLYHAIAGPGLAALLTSNPNEWPAVWCLLSIGLLLIVVKTPVRDYLYTKECWWFNWLGIKKAKK